jgi:hypothetical protein
MCKHTRLSLLVTLLDFFSMYHGTELQHSYEPSLLVTIKRSSAVFLIKRLSGYLLSLWKRSPSFFVSLVILMLSQEQPNYAHLILRIFALYCHQDS